MSRFTAGDLSYRAKRWAADGAGAELRARWLLRGARSVGARPRVIGRPMISTPDLRIGDDFLLWSHHRVTHLGGTGTLEIGDRVFVNTGAVVLAFSQVSLADGAGLASEVFISDSDNHSLPDRPLNEAPIVIGRGSWIATRAMIMPGVHIGERAVVAAGAVVTSDVDDDTLVAGVPARPIRKLVYPPGRGSAWRDELR